MRRRRNRSVEPKSSADLGGARGAASRRQIEVRDDRENSRSRGLQLHHHVEQQQLNDAGRQRVLQQEMTQRTIVVRMRWSRVLMWRLRLRNRLGMMMVMPTAGARMLRGFRRSRALRVCMSRRMLVRVDDGGGGRDQQRTRCQPCDQASSQPVEHALHSVARLSESGAVEKNIRLEESGDNRKPSVRDGAGILLVAFQSIKTFSGFCRIVSLAIG